MVDLRDDETGKVPGPVMVWPPQQTGAFLDFIADERLYSLFHPVALRSLRRAEVAGLPWSETDLNAGTITIRETRPDGGLYIDDPKSESPTVAPQDDTFGLSEDHDLGETAGQGGGSGI